MSVAEKWTRQVAIATAMARGETRPELRHNQAAPAPARVRDLEERFESQARFPHFLAPSAFTIPEFTFYPIMTPTLPNVEVTSNGPKSNLEGGPVRGGGSLPSQ